MEEVFLTQLVSSGRVSMYLNLTYLLAFVSFALSNHHMEGFFTAMCSRFVLCREYLRGTASRLCLCSQLNPLHPWSLCFKHCSD